MCSEFQTTQRPLILGYFVLLHQNKKGDVPYLALGGTHSCVYVSICTHLKGLALSFLILSSLIYTVMFSTDN